MSDIDEELYVILKTFDDSVTFSKYSYSVREHIKTILEPQWISVKDEPLWTPINNSGDWILTENGEKWILASMTYNACDKDLIYGHLDSSTGVLSYQDTGLVTIWDKNDIDYYMLIPEQV